MKMTLPKWKGFLLGDNYLKEVRIEETLCCYDFREIQGLVPGMGTWLAIRVVKLKTKSHQDVILNKTYNYAHPYLPAGRTTMFCPLFQIN